MNEQNKDEALRMAIKSLNRYGDTYGGTDGDFEALNACERALEQPTQERQGLSDEALQLAIEAIENFKNVKGRYNTQIACEKLYAILPILKEAKEKNHYK